MSDTSATLELESDDALGTVSVVSELVVVVAESATCVSDEDAVSCALVADAVSEEDCCCWVLSEDTGADDDDWAVSVCVCDIDSKEAEEE